ncbi:hypothetical protein EKE94_16320 [Mesobaculum littorinae]|uniref:Cation/multidrug efflux pump n=1 Tax=Mesobaculum littorinae TaxID=2486419 RepID=A0A438AE60_9RHOB|nr:hypothetical protein EKE94_16320 [Mesobaculum littorinae]
MFQIVRLAVLGFLALSVLYWLVSLYSRSIRRERLERAWEEAGRPGPRETFVEDGLRAYDGSVRRKLILLVYVVPPLVVLAVIYLTNFY